MYTEGCGVMYRETKVAEAYNLSFAHGDPEASRGTKSRLHNAKCAISTKQATFQEVPSVHSRYL
jgi:hypothetical protein